MRRGGVEVDVGVAAELAVVGPPPGVGGLDDPAQPEPEWLFLAPGILVPRSELARAIELCGHASEHAVLERRLRDIGAARDLG